MTPTINSSSIEVLIMTRWDDSEQCYYAWSPQLGCTRDGTTEDEAVELCKEALEILVEGLAERQAIGAFLAAHGYEVAAGESTLKNGVVFHRDGGTNQAVSSVVKRTIPVNAGVPLGH